MPIEFRCPTCRKTHTLAETLAGKSFQCWDCGGTATVPKPTRRPAERDDSDDDDDELDDRPRRRRIKKKSSSNTGLVIGLIVGSLLILIAIVGIGIYFAVNYAKKNFPPPTNPPAQVATAPNGAGNPFARPNAPATAAPVDVNDLIAKQYPTVQEKMTLSAPQRGMGLGTAIPYTLTIEPEPDPFANMPGPKFGPKIVRPPRYNVGTVWMVTVVNGECKENMVMGSFLWDKQGTLEFRTLFGQLPPQTPFFLIGSGKERISNVIFLP